MSSKTGRLVMTIAVSDEFDINNEFKKEVTEALRRYMECDWGNLVDEDKKLNDVALKIGNVGIMGAYKTCKGGLYIITERDRSVTTILFADEY